jgi:UDP-N-acetylmuramoyl-tripeptide--D-alanyl-D-alanine ligase
MGEVGAQGVAFHAEVGAHARARGIDALWTAGRLSTHTAGAYGAARHFDDVGSLLAALPEAPPCASVLVKGSRFMQMERVVAALLEAASVPAKAATAGSPPHAA